MCFFTKRKMTKRLKDVPIFTKSDTSFLLLDLPDDMILLILGLTNIYYLGSMFDLLSLNRDSLNRFQRIIPLIYSNGYNVYVDSRGLIDGVHHKKVLRYMAGLIYSLDIYDDHNDVIKGDTVMKFYNVSYLKLNNMKYITVNEHLTKMPKLSNLDLSGHNTNSYFAYPNIHLLTNLKTLSLSNNSTITDDKLRKMTSLTSLDISYNWKITEYGIAPLTCLQYLHLPFGRKKDFEKYISTHVLSTRIVF